MVAHERDPRPRLRECRHAVVRTWRLPSVVERVTGPAEADVAEALGKLQQREPRRFVLDRAERTEIKCVVGRAATLDPGQERFERSGERGAGAGDRRSQKGAAAAVRHSVGALPLVLLSPLDGTFESGEARLDAVWYQSPACGRARLRAVRWRRDLRGWTM